MRKLYLLKTILLLCALVAGSSAWADDTYSLITSNNDLEVGGEYIIVSEEQDIAMGVINSSSRGTGVGVTILDHTVTLSSTSEVNVLTLGGTSESYTLLGNQDNKYIGYNSGTKMQSSTTASTDKYKWIINLSNTKATIQNKGDNNRYIRTYDSGPDFRPYSESQSGSSNVKLYKKIDASAPSISTNNVNVAYNAASGTITYTITNPVDGASVTAGTSTGWISNFSYATAETVTFDVSKNVTSEDRAGTVTLTYANGGTTLATKEVTVTQGHLDVAAPTFSVAAGIYNAVQNVTLSTATDGATIYYTTNGTEPSTSSSTYSSSITVDATKTLKAIAVKDGVNSTIAEAVYELKVATPTISPNGGTFDESQDVTLACETASATIYYTLDDTTPTNESTLYSTAFTLTDSKTVKVIAFKDGWTASEVASSTFTKTDPNNVWVKTGLSALGSDDIFVIVEDHGSYKYAMSNDKGTSNAPTAVKVTISNNLISGDVADNIKWNISGNANNGYKFYPNGSTTTWLYCNNSNDGTRVGTNTNYCTFEIKSNFIFNKANSRYVGIYNTQDWRCYTSINTNISGQTFSIYKKGITVTLSSACTDGTKYYGTFCSSVPFKVPADVTVSEIGIDNGGKLIVQNYATGAVVPANTGVMISSTTAGKKILTLASGGSSLLGDNNCLRSSGFAISDQTTTGTNCLFYRLTMHNGTDLGFYWGAASGAAFAIGANKAYLAVPTSLAREGFWFEDDAASVEEKVSVNGEESAAAVYDLQGRRVAQPTKGLYIVNGKKVIVK